jgi:hypothetical protein
MLRQPTIAAKGVGRPILFNLREAASFVGVRVVQIEKHLGRVGDDEND